MRKHSLRISLSRRTAGASGALLLVVIAVVAIVSAGSPSTSKGASPSGNASGSTTVQYRNLIATDTESGTLSYANPQTVYNRVDGTITWLPAVGQIIKPGGTLFDVDNAPVILFDGTTPAYRDLDSSDSDGPDILELNRDLKKMGYDPSNEITVNDAWQTGTTNAVDSWQNSLGETETGTISLGQIVFLPGRQEIDALDTTVGSTGSSGGDNAAAGDTDYELGTAHPEFVSLTTTPDTGATGSTGATGPTGPASDTAARDAADTCNGLDVQQNENGSQTSNKKAGDTSAGGSSKNAESPPPCYQKGTTGTTGATGSKKPSQEAVLLALLKAETLELKKTLGESGTTGRGTTGTTTGGATGSGREEAGGGGGSVESSGASSGASGSSGDEGSSGAGATAILQTSSTDVIVSVPLPATNQSEAVVGERVQVEMPAGNTVAGKITIVSPIATSSSSGSGSSGSGGSSGGSGSSGNSGSSSSATIPVTIALLSHHLPTTGLDQAAVSVNFAQQVENHVLSVPVTALLATAGGGYAVQEAASPHKLIPVTPGLFAAGDVQISGSGIYPGLQVTDSQG
jgi:hypothetical protein